MRRRRRRGSQLLAVIALPLVVICVLLLFTAALNNLNSDRHDESRRLLEDSLHRAATICYAAEGCYPPTLEQLCERCGIQIDQNRFAVFYDCFAENLMPDITVLDKGYGKATDETT